MDLSISVTKLNIVSFSVVRLCRVGTCVAGWQYLLRISQGASMVAFVVALLLTLTVADLPILFISFNKIEIKVNRY